MWQWLNEKPVDTTDPLSTYFDVESKTLKAYASKVNSELSSKDMVSTPDPTRGNRKSQFSEFKGGSMPKVESTDLNGSSLKSFFIQLPYVKPTSRARRSRRTRPRSTQSCRARTWSAPHPKNETKDELKSLYPKEAQTPLPEIRNLTS